VFLKNEVQRLKVLISSAAQEERQREGEAGQLIGHWRGPIPYMRLIMCLTQDYDIKAAFLWRVDARSRQELDASNLSVRPPTVFEMIADTWNDKDFNPIAPASDCDKDFFVATNCAYSQVSMLQINAVTAVANHSKLGEEWTRGGGPT
jgi:hypothetical protein